MKIKKIVMPLILMQMNISYAEQKINPTEQAISQVASFCELDETIQYTQFLYIGTVDQLKLEAQKCYSVKGVWVDMKELPADTIVVKARLAPHRSSLKGGYGYFFCHTQSGEIIAYLLMK